MTNVMYVMTKSKYMTFSIHQMIEDQPRPRVSQALFTLLMDAREYPGIGWCEFPHSVGEQYVIK